MGTDYSNLEDDFKKFINDHDIPWPEVVGHRELTEEQKESSSRFLDKLAGKRVDDPLLDKMVYKNVRYAVLDYEQYRSNIGEEIEVAMPEQLFSIKGLRTYLLNLSLRDNELHGTKWCFDRESEQWKKSKNVFIPFTGFFVLIPIHEGDKVLSVTDFLDYDIAYELRFEEGKLVGENDLSDAIQEWMDIKECAKKDGKVEIVRNNLKGSYNFSFGYSNIIMIEGLKADKKMDEESDLGADLDPVWDWYMNKARSKGDKASSDSLKKRDKRMVIKKKLSRKYAEMSNHCIDHYKDGFAHKIAFWLSNRSAVDGDPFGLFTLGFCYMNGIGVEENPKKALRCFGKLASKDSVAGCMATAYVYDKEDTELFNSQLATRYFAKAAFLGNAEAMYELGNNYSIGRGCRKDLAKAKYWLEKAAMNGNDTALYKLALLYDHKLNDKEDAFGWYLLSAERGNPSAAYHVATLYESGYGTDQNKKEAYEWYVKAASCGHLLAKERLIHLYPNGEENLNSY